MSARVQTVPGCSDCVSDCNSESCDQPAECTDQCRIVTCNDPTHSDDCNGACIDACSLSLDCEDESTCEDQSLECCVRHPELCESQDVELTDPGIFSFTPFVTSQFYPQGYQYSPPSNSTSVSLSSPPSAPSIESISSPSSVPYTPVAIFEHDGLSIFENSDPLRDNRSMRLPHRCLWNGCSFTFPTSEELVAHVNAAHLWWATQPALNATLNTTDSTGCMWDHCTTYPTIGSIPGTSRSTSYQPLATVLTEHLIHDHLGLFENPAIENFPVNPHGNVDVDPVTNSLPTPEQEMTCTLSHLCHWKGCHKAFHGCSELHEHLISEHLGSGKARYECHWDACPRHGERGFSSKQKVLRHLQTHTGHRPYRCDLCGLHFSEPATLQQHMRRHTSEKPFICDFPGCTKSFTVKGALTIHQRIHNGEKPFKCTFCDRAFAESSNLSKHLRTHTGAKPYGCPEVGCGKRFARVDQLQRHVKTHRKIFESAGCQLSDASALPT